LRILAIDPGTTESGWAIIDADTCQPLDFGKSANGKLLDRLRHDLHVADVIAIEMVASYGMPVGKDVFTTVLWIGRFYEAVERNRDAARRPELHDRGFVKVHLCRSVKANDANIRQALVDRFAEGQPNFGKGTKAKPGFFHGFAVDVWQAYALAVCVADEHAQVHSS
jgi:hypothetical protein